jgi:hypothetical protein
MYGCRIWVPLVLLGLFGPGCARDAAGPQTPGAYDSNALQSLRIPGGQRCLDLLDQLGVKYQRLSPRGRVATPVEVVGDIAGVRYVTEGRPSLVCDCRLALALHWSAPVLLAWNVSEIEHYGAYANRTTRQGRPSLHARGLALDAARFKFSSVSQSVSEDYARGWGPGCWPEAPALNQIVCRLRSLGLFRELITPDHNSDHHDHVHLAIVPL